MWRSSFPLQSKILVYILQKGTGSKVAYTYCRVSDCINYFPTHDWLCSHEHVFFQLDFVTMKRECWAQTCIFKVTAMTNVQKHKLKWKRLNVDVPPAPCPPCQYSCPKVVSILAQKSSRDVKTSHHNVTWCHDVVAWRHMASNGMAKWICLIYTGLNIKVWKSRFYMYFISSTADAGGKKQKIIVNWRCALRVEKH